MLNDTRNELTTPMEYLFGLNEAWDNSSSKASLKFSTPHEMVRAWSPDAAGVKSRSTGEPEPGGVVLSARFGAANPMNAANAPTYSAPDAGGAGGELSSMRDGRAQSGGWI